MYCSTVRMRGYIRLFRKHSFNSKICCLNRRVHDHGIRMVPQASSRICDPDSILSTIDRADMQTLLVNMSHSTCAVGKTTTCPNKIELEVLTITVYVLRQIQSIGVTANR